MKQEGICVTCWGSLTVTLSEKGITRLSLPFPSGDVPISEPDFFKKIRRLLEGYFSGRSKEFDLEVDLTGLTPFQKRVLRIVETIPYGETRTYRQVAEAAGCPKGARAVGQVMAVNPVPIIIPCHRVVASGGFLGGYTGGLEMKTRLLELEGIKVGSGGKIFMKAGVQS